MDTARLGTISLERFVITLSTVLTSNKKNFDIIASAGNSGQVMIKLSEMVYSFLQIPFPISVVFPIYRYKNFPKKKLFNNSSIATDYKHVKLPKKPSHILFVDDEIEEGIAAQTTYNILQALNATTSDAVLTILAEDGGFTTDILTGMSQVNFIAPQKRPEGLYSAISYAIPNAYYQPIQHALQQKGLFFNKKHIMCILLHLPTKETNNGNPRFTFYKEETIKEVIPNLNDLQTGYHMYLTTTIASIVEKALTTLQTTR